jgi:uncharacterized protein (TIGR01244 family)
MTNTRCASHEMSVARDSEPLLQYQVTDEVLLAGQPEPEDWARLAAQGFRTVVNMRTDPERAATQAGLAHAAGLESVHLPLPAYELEPEHLAEFNHVVTSGARGKMVIHCRSASRVALAWLLKRIVHDGWTREQAKAELRAAGYDDDAMETFAYCADDYFERATLMPADS